MRAATALQPFMGSAPARLTRHSRVELACSEEGEEEVYVPSRKEGDTGTPHVSSMEQYRAMYFDSINDPDEYGAVLPVELLIWLSRAASVPRF